MTELSLCLADFLSLFLPVICSKLSSSRSLVLCADGGTSSSQPASSYASLISPLSQTLLPFSFFALHGPSHLPPLTLFYCSFLSFGILFFCVLLHLPWLFPPPQWLHVFVIVCQVLGHLVKLASVCFCSCCVNPEGTFWVQKLLFACHSICMSYYLVHRPPAGAKGEWERDFEVVSSLSIVEGLCPQWVG